MRSRWSDEEAQRYVETYAGVCSREVALRVYTSHLIGAEPSLVLHGGGNTSVKGTVKTLLGDEVDALFVKGSGWNLGTIEPAGFPAVDLAHMRRVAAVPTLSDEAMVNEQRTHLFDAASPNPSIETLVHAVIDATYVDHSHADAILALTNHPEGERYVREALGSDIVLVDYVKPGFDLCRATLAALSRFPDARAMVLMQHGLFTWGETAREAYESHISLVSKAEAYLAAHPPEREPRCSPDDVAEARASAGRVAPLLRGALAEEVGEGWRRWVLEHRVDEDILAQVNSDRLDRWVAAGTLTPDHVIRTKPRACVVRVDLSGDDAAIRQQIDAAVAAYRQAYEAYFTAHAAGGAYTMLDTTPRVILVPGVGLFGVGKDPKAARINVDLTVHTLEVKEGCEGLGPFEGLPDDLLFEIEYWSLEQAKLGKKKEPMLGRRVALVTGAAGAIGFGVARSLLDAGACVVLADIDEAGLQRVEERLNGGARVASVRMDITDAASVRWGFEQASLAFGGVDLVVPNAGIAHSRTIADLDERDWRRVMEVNANGTFLTVREAARHLKAQGAGGQIVLVSSKNVFGPGAAFAAYSASKAAAHQLCKIAALELAPHGIRVNMVAPDAVFSESEVQSGLWREIGADRAHAKGLTEAELPDHYRNRNLLRARVTGSHVGEAVVFFAREATPTTGASLPVDGGVAGAFPR
ncbi:MAG: bifunctional aldolase/short-chain dehydrogenase [Myxococcota bacterium]